MEGEAGGTALSADIGQPLLEQLVGGAQSGPQGLVGPADVSSFWRSSACTICHSWSARTWRFSSARFWLIITNVDKKMASSETIIVSSPKG